MPIALLVYVLVPKPAKLPVLAAAGLCFYAASGPVSLIYIGMTVIFNYLTGLEIFLLKTKESKKKLLTVLIAAVAANLFVLGIFKYFTGSMPLGISFYTFSVLSYLFDVYRDRAPAEENLLKFAIYVTFFPKIISGPIVQYKDFKEQLDKVNVTTASVRTGARMFLAGLFKKVLLADRLGIAFAALTESTYTGGAAWLGVLFFSLQLYFDFSGYSDMAIGLSKMFGFDIEPNFDYPYTSENVSVFWRRWHISLGEWFKQYVYFPLGGSRVSTWRIIINIMVVWALTGLWHGSTWNFLIWGLYNGGLVLLDKFVVGKYIKKLPPPVQVAITVFAICMGWVFFFSPSLSGAGLYFAAMFGGAGVPSAGIGASVLARNAVLLIVSVIGCTRIPKNIFESVFYRNSGDMGSKVLYALFAVITAALLLLTIAELIGATNSTFLYAQF